MIETKRLILRPYNIDDIDDLYKIISDKETMKYFDQPYTYEQTIRWVNWSIDHYKRYGFSFFAVILKETGQFIGNCGLTLQTIDNEILPEIGYHIHKDYMRQGYGSEAAIAVKDWAFLNTEYNDLYSYMSKDNEASVKVAIKNGMKHIKDYEEDNKVYSVYKITRADLL